MSYGQGFSETLDLRLLSCDRPCCLKSIVILSKLKNFSDTLDLCFSVRASQKLQTSLSYLWTDSAALNLQQHCPSSKASQELQIYVLRTGFLRCFRVLSVILEQILLRLMYSSFIQIQKPVRICRSLSDLYGNLVQV